MTLFQPYGIPSPPILLVAFIFMLPYPSTAQNSTLDSLLSELSTIPDNRKKVIIYGKVFQHYKKIRSANDLSRKYADSSLYLAEKLGDSLGIAYGHYYHAQLDQFEGEYNTAITRLNKFIDFQEKANDSIRLANGLFELGKNYKQLGEFDKSLAHLLRSLEIYEKAHDREGMALSLNSIAGIELKLGKVDQAIQNYQRANKVYLALGKIKNYAMGLQNIGNLHASNQHLDSALSYFHQAFTIITPLDADFEKAIILGNLGESYNQAGQHQKALEYHLQAYALKRKLPNKRSLAIGISNLGETYLKLNQLNKAERYLTEAYDLALRIGAKDVLITILDKKSALAKRLKDYQQAYERNLESQQWKDSILNESVQKQISELEIKYETQKKDQRLVLLTKENELKNKEAERQATLKKAFLIGFVLISLLTLSLVYSHRQKLKNQRLLLEKDNKIKEIKLRKHMTDLEMKALRAQINPHFLFNCMNSINRLILEEDNDTASRYLTKFSKLVRLILEHAESNKVSLSNELSLVESYIHLEGLRFKNKISYEIVVDSSIDTETTYIPSMVLQPFIENSIWHGLMHKSDPEKGHIKIFIHEQDKKLFCSIEDNGVGRDKAQEINQQSVVKTKSLGMKITEERLRLINPADQEEVIKVTDLKNAVNEVQGTRVEISLPIQFYV